MFAQNPSLLKKQSSLTPAVPTTATTHNSLSNQTVGFPLYLVIYNNEKMKISPNQMRQIFRKETYKFVSIKMHLHKWNFRVQFGFQCKELRNQAIEEIRKIKEKYDVGYYYYFNRGHVTYSLMEEWEYRNAINFGNQNEPVIANSLPPVPSLVKVNSLSSNLPKQKHDKQHIQRRDSQKILPLPKEDKIETKDNKISELTKKTSKGKKQTNGEQKILSQRNITHLEKQQKVNEKENLADKEKQQYHRSKQQQLIANENMKIEKQNVAKSRQAQLDQDIELRGEKQEEMVDQGQKNIVKKESTIKQEKQEDLEQISKQKANKRSKIVSTNEKQVEKETQKMATKSSKQQRKSKQKDKTTQKQALKKSKIQKQKQTGKQSQAMKQKQIDMEMEVQKKHEDNAMQVQDHRPIHENTVNQHDEFEVDGTGMQMTVNKGMEKYIKDMQIQKILNDFDMVQKLLRLEIMLIDYMS